MKSGDVPKKMCYLIILIKTMHEECATYLWPLWTMLGLKLELIISFPLDLSLFHKFLLAYYDLLTHNRLCVVNYGLVMHINYALQKISFSKTIARI